MRGMYVAYRLAQGMSNTLPAPCAFELAERLADVRWRGSAADRAAVQANLAWLRGRPVTANDASVREVFRNFGRYLVEFFTMHRRREGAGVVEGREHLDAAMAAGRGAIALAAHLGNWELGGAWFRRMGFPIAAVALPHDDSRMDRLFNAQRQRCGVEVIPLGVHAARTCLRRLREGWLLGLVGDREFMDHGVSVHMRGRDVTLPRGPATLSLRSRAPLVPTFVVRTGRWAFRLCLEPPIWPESFHREDDAVRAVTQRYATVLGRYLVQFPDQWLVFRPFVGQG